MLRLTQCHSHLKEGSYPRLLGDCHVLYGEQPTVNMSKDYLPCRPFPSWLMSTRRSSVLSPLLQPVHQSISQLLKIQEAVPAGEMEMLS